MKANLSRLSLLLFSTSLSALENPNVLFVDSSFPPIVNARLNFRPPTCPWMTENQLEVNSQGPCYDVAEWSELTSEDVGRLKGLVDTLSGTTSSDAKLWQGIEAKFPEEAVRVKGRFLLAVHGTRSIAVAALSSRGQLRPLALRSLTSKAGSEIRQSSSSLGSTSGTSKMKPYSNGCPLANWQADELKSFEQGRLRPAQESLAAQLAQFPSLRIVNISLGYKRSWIAEDNPRCDAAQVEQEYALLTATWQNLFRKFPDRLFVVAAGNEAENFDRPELGDADLWSRLSGEPNLILVGAMTAAGTRLATSNLGLPIEVFALGELIPALTPLPTVISGHPSRLQGTSFSAPLVSGRALALWTKTPRLSVSEIKQQIVDTFRKEQFNVLFAAYEKLCRGDRTLDACLETIAELVARPLLWGDTHLRYLKGRLDWNFKPFVVQFQKDLPVLGQTKLIEVNGEKIPSLLLKPSTNPYELLITIHHEIFHFSNMAESARSYSAAGRLNDCVTPYQLALLKDELPAYQQEAIFFESAPAWFKKKLSGKKSRSQLLQKNIDAPNFYRELKAATAHDPKFLVKRLVDLGSYPPCVIDLF
jgi:hypothetical protein